MQHRRQAKGKQQRQAHAQAKQHRPQRGRGQRRFHQAGQQQHKTVVHGVANRHTQAAGQQANQRELQRVAQGDGALAQAQHAQHGAVVQMAGGKATRGQRHGHRAQQRRQQGDQVEEFFGTVHGLAHLGPAIVQRFDPHAAHLGLFDFFLGPLHKRLHLRVFPRNRHAVGESAGRLDQACRRNIGPVDHHAGCKVHETSTPVGFNHDEGADAKRGIAQQQRIAHAQVQRVQQGCVNPGLAGFGDGPGFCLSPVGLCGHRQAAPQRVARLNHLERYQF